MIGTGGGRGVRCEGGGRDRGRASAGGSGKPGGSHEPGPSGGRSGGAFGPGIRDRQTRDRAEEGCPSRADDPCSRTRRPRSCAACRTRIRRSAADAPRSRRCPTAPAATARGTNARGWPRRNTPRPDDERLRPRPDSEGTPPRAAAIPADVSVRAAHRLHDILDARARSRRRPRSALRLDRCHHDERSDRLDSAQPRPEPKPEPERDGDANNRANGLAATMAAHVAPFETAPRRATARLARRLSLSKCQAARERLAQDPDGIDLPVRASRRPAGKARRPRIVGRRKRETAPPTGMHRRPTGSRGP